MAIPAFITLIGSGIISLNMAFIQGKEKALY